MRARQTRTSHDYLSDACRAEVVHHRSGNLLHLQRALAREHAILLALPITGQPRLRERHNVGMHSILQGIMGHDGL